MADKDKNAEEQQHVPLSQMRSLRYTPHAPFYGSSERVALIAELDANSPLTLVTLDNDPLEIKTRLTSMYNEGKEPERAEFANSKGETMTLTFTDKGNVMLKVDKQSDYDYKAVIAQAETNIRSVGLDIAMAKYSGKTTAEADIPSDDELLDNIEEAVPPVIEEMPVFPSHDNERAETPAHNDELPVAIHANEKIDVPSSLIDTETTGFVPILPHKNQLEHQNDENTPKNNEAERVDVEEQQDTTEISNDKTEVLSRIEDDESATLAYPPLINDINALNNDISTLTKENNATAETQLLPTIRHAEHGALRDDSETQNETFSNVSWDAEKTQYYEPIFEPEEPPTATLYNYGDNNTVNDNVPIENTTACNERQESSFTSTETQILPDIHPEDSTYDPAITAEQLRQANNHKAISKPKPLIVALIILLGIALVGAAFFGFDYVVKSTATPSVTDTTTSEDNTIVNKEDNGADAIVSAGWDIDRLAENAKNFTAGFFDLKHDDVVAGTWQQKWSSYADIETNNSSRYGDMIAMSSTDTWKESVEHHVAFNITLRSFDKISWGITDYGNPICYLTTIIERPVLFYYGLNSPDIELNVYKDTYKIIFDNDYKVLRIDEYKSEIDTTSDTSEGTATLIAQDISEWNKYKNEATNKAAEETAKQKQEEDAKKAQEEDAKIEQEERQRQSKQQSQQNSQSASGTAPTTPKEDVPSGSNNNTGTSGNTNTSSDSGTGSAGTNSNTGSGSGNTSGATNGNTGASGGNTNSSSGNTSNE